MKDWKKIMLVACLVALSSELYWNIFSSSFRISLSVILLPVLLMTLGKDLPTVKTCSITAFTVFIFRALLASSRHLTLVELSELLLPNAAFYICYGLIFSTFILNKHTCSYKLLFPTLFSADLVSNSVELCILEMFQPGSLTVQRIGVLMAVATFRSLFSTLFLFGEAQYRTLLKREEHENRYRRLFLMTSALKNEIYFMKKNSAEIEAIMGNAYRVYERLSLMDNIPDDMKQMSLAIARDVHEIKKDYIRIIQGIEQEISDEYDEKRMSFLDLLNILEATTHHLLEEKTVRIQLEFECEHDFTTAYHYELMAILKNLVTNAIEAFEGAHKNGTIHLSEHLIDGVYEFVVQDNGPGISPRHLPNIFKMGYSTKFDYKTGNIYRGVGLFGVKATIEDKFGGTIDVESELKKGTTFTIRIPEKALEEG